MELWAAGLVNGLILGVPSRPANSFPTACHHFRSATDVSLKPSREAHDRPGSFHNGLAKDLAAVVDLYDARFSIGFTNDERMTWSRYLRRCRPRPVRHAADDAIG
jgi:hypothetical protein